MGEAEQGLSDLRGLPLTVAGLPRLAAPRPFPVTLFSLTGHLPLLSAQPLLAPMPHSCGHSAGRQPLRGVHYNSTGGVRTHSTGGRRGVPSLARGKLLRAFSEREQNTQQAHGQQRAALSFLPASSLLPTQEAFSSQGALCSWSLESPHHRTQGVAAFEQFCGILCMRT